MILDAIFNIKETIQDSYKHVEVPGHFNQGKPETDIHHQLLSLIDRWLFPALTMSES